MKKILYTLLAGAMALSSCSKSNDMPTAPQGEATTFTLAVDAAETRATSAVTPDRYIMEVWSEDGTTAENVFENNTTNHAEITSGNAFTVTLDKTKAYTCLFWADDNYAFNAASLKAISLNGGKWVTEAYFSKVAVAKGKNPSVAVILKRAVAKITLTETATVKTTDHFLLKLSNIYRTFSVLDAQASGTASEFIWATSPAATTGIIGTFYFFAKADKELSDLEFKCNAAPWNTVSNIPIQQNFATNIKGDYSQRSSCIFTVTADDEWNTPDNDVNFGTKVMIGDFYYKDKTFSSTYTADAANPCIGIVFWVDPVNVTKGKIVGLTEETSKQWSTGRETTAATSNNDGKDNTDRVFAMSDFSVTAYPAFALVKSQNDANTIAGITWYLPALLELKGGIWANEATLNTSLEKVAGAAKLSTNYYWSSTEGSGYDVWQVYFYSGSTRRDAKYNNSSVRVVSAF